MRRDQIDSKVLNELLIYCPLTGILRWKERGAHLFLGGSLPAEHRRNRWNAKYAGRAAFTNIMSSGYLQGNIFNLKFYAHRVIMCMVYGFWPDEVDHINGMRGDNRLINLRCVNRKENMRNLSLSSRNKSGDIGVRWMGEYGKWRAEIQVNGKNIYLGHFKLLDDAKAARAAAERRYGFHRNHGRRNGLKEPLLQLWRMK